MPTKINRAGQQQNYVPKGNGDASGEYGDNVNGSNKHFKAFAKPTETSLPQLTDQEKIDKVRQRLLDDLEEYHQEFLEGHNFFMTDEEYQRGLERINDFNERYLLRRFESEFPEYRKKYASFDDYIKETQTKEGEEFANSLMKSYTYGQEEGKKLINVLINDKNINYTLQGETEKEKERSYFSSYDNKIKLADGDFVDEKESNYSNGGVFYHENGHAIDYAFGEMYGNRTYASETFRTSTGKTLKETLMGRQIPPITKRFEEAKKEVENFVNDYIRSANEGVYNELEAISNEAKATPEYIAKKEEMNSLIRQNDELLQRTRTGSANELTGFDKKKYDFYQANIREAESELDGIEHRHREFEQIDLRTKLSKTAEEARKAKNKVFGDISDMFCMQGYGYELGMGHSSSYAKDTKRRAKEFFAECFSAENTNPESLKRIKKYFPEGYKAYREIVDAMNSGEIKTKIQQKLELNKQREAKKNG